MPHYTTEQKDEALRLYMEHGPAEAGRRMGIRPDTISVWAHRTKNGQPVSTVRDVSDPAPSPERLTQKRRAALVIALESSQLSRKEKAERLAARLLEEATTELDRLRQPMEEWRVSGSGKEFVRTWPEPPPDQRRQVATTLAILLDKSQLLAGEPTERTEQMTVEQITNLRDDLAARRKLREAG